MAWMTNYTSLFYVDVIVYSRLKFNGGYANFSYEQKKMHEIGNMNQYSRTIV